MTIPEIDNRIGNCKWLLEKCAQYSEKKLRGDPILIEKYVKAFNKIYKYILKTTKKL